MLRGRQGHYGMRTRRFQTTLPSCSSDDDKTDKAIMEREQEDRNLFRMTLPSCSSDEDEIYGTRTRRSIFILYDSFFLFSDL